MSQETETLVARAARAFAAYQNGDSAAMSELVDTVSPLLWHTARAQGLDQTAADDVVQTTWLKLVQRTAEIADSQAVVKWLLTTTRRESWAVARRSTRDSVELDEGVDPTPFLLPDQPLDAVVRSESQRLLWAHVQRLSDRCRYLLRIIAVAERPDYEAIAEALGMPVGSIGPTRGRCLAKLRISLETDPHWEGAR